MILLNRPIEESTSSQIKLKNLRFESIISPLITIKYIPHTIDFSNYDYLLITSFNAIKKLNINSALPSKALVVGEKSAEALQNLGVEVELIAPTAESLCKLIIKKINSESKIIYLGGNHSAFNIQNHLLKHNFTIEKNITYKSVINKNFDPQILEKVSTVLLYSPRTAKVLAKFCYKSHLLENIRIICISLRTANELNDLHCNKILIAREPNENSMFELLND